MASKPFHNQTNKGGLSPWVPTTNSTQTPQVDYAIEASRLVVETLQNIGSMAGLPYLNQAADIALRILTIVQDVRNRSQEFTDLANDACGLVYTIAIECQGMMKDGQQVPQRVQVHIVTLSRNLSEIETFAKRKLKRGPVKKLIYHSKDIEEITRYRTLLRQALDIFGIQSSISIQQNLQLILKNLERQRDDLNSAQERQRAAEKDIASCLAAIQKKEEDHETERREEAQRAERVRLQELEDAKKRRKSAERAERQRKEEEESLRRLKADNMHFPPEHDNLHSAVRRRTPSPQPLPYGHLQPQPGFPPPGFPYLYPGYPGYAASPYHLGPPMSPPMPGGMLINNVSGSAISFGGAPTTNWNSGNVSNTTIENVGNNYSVRGRKSPRRAARRNDSESEDD